MSSGFIDGYERESQENAVLTTPVACLQHCLGMSSYLPWAGMAERTERLLVPKTAKAARLTLEEMRRNPESKLLPARLG